ncbi:hypothetical protein QE390_005045 [Siphonobacter sp. SORGH_AS 1065]|nr:hypothetical protein [Siphonobacter sp. SORGH_AS_1065]
MYKAIKRKSLWLHISRETNYIAPYQKLVFVKPIESKSSKTKGRVKPFVLLLLLIFYYSRYADQSNP